MMLGITAKKIMKLAQENLHLNRQPGRTGQGRSERLMISSEMNLCGKFARKQAIISLV